MVNIGTHRPWPDVWGEGSLFAFSGMDGPTDCQSPMIGNYDAAHGTIRFHLLGCDLAWPDTTGRSVSLAINDAFVMESSQGRCAVTFANWHTLIGSYPSGSAAMLRHNGQSIQPDVNGMEVVDVEDGSAWMALVTRNGKFSLSYGSARDEVMTRAHEGLTIDTEQTLASRLATYHCLPRLDEDRHDQLLCKCFSVMRVNTCGPEGIFRQHWSTTSRLPHRWLWLWDSAFHAVGMCPFDAPLAWEFLESVFDGQRDDGMVPHCVEPSGLTSHITQPPLLAWAAAEVPLPPPPAFISSSTC